MEDMDFIRNLFYGFVAKEFRIHSALYPGCALDLGPSFYIPKVTYIDDAPFIANDFFKKEKLFLEKINQQKFYSASCHFAFLAQDYHTVDGLPEFDLLISQYAGNVGQVMKSCLKAGGILMVAEGPADAELAFRDPDYEFLGTLRYNHGNVNLSHSIEPSEYLNQNIELSRNFCFQKK